MGRNNNRKRKRKDRRVKSEPRKGSDNHEIVSEGVKAIKRPRVETQEALVAHETPEGE